VPVTAQVTIKGFSCAFGMHIEDTLTLDDALRAQPLPLTHSQYATAYNVGLRAIDAYLVQLVNPTLTALKSPSERAAAFIGLHYRVHGFLKTAIALTTVEHAQSLMAATRSVIELYYDAELLHQNKIENGVERLHAFTDTQRLAYARKTVAFYDLHPQFNDEAIIEMRNFVSAKASDIDGKTIRIWGAKENGTPNIVEHWSGRNVKARAALLGATFEKMVIDGYDVRNWHTHSGLAGVANLQPESFVAMCSLALSDLHKCALGTVGVVAAEFKEEQAFAGAKPWLERLRTLPGSVLTDL
jgi:hypothetical protein